MSWFKRLLNIFSKPKIAETLPKLESELQSNFLAQCCTQEIKAHINSSEITDILKTHENITTDITCDTCGKKHYINIKAKRGL
jgi:hypothetical protein